jgi:hypothetical protein
LEEKHILFTDKLLVETTIERVYFDIDGDKDLVDIINDFSSAENEKEDRVKIVNYKTNSFELLSTYNGKTRTSIFVRAK